MIHPISLRPDRSHDALSAEIGRSAIWALYTELSLAPKPGLVSPLDNGSHADMDLGTFMRSLSALRPYFREIAAAGAADAPFATLARLGQAAERRMLAATGGINTHRGAVFCIGLLAAAAGLRRVTGLDVPLGRIVSDRWGPEIMAAGTKAGPSHGSVAVQDHGVRGARQEAAEGFPTLYRIVLPALHQALAVTGCRERAGIQALFASMAHLADTNLLHRGGKPGLDFIRDRAGAFLAGGGALRAGWREEALALHHDSVARWLSPGGSADMLAAVWFLWSQGEG